MDKGPGAARAYIEANIAIEDKARALIVKVLRQAAERDDPHGSFYELASDVADARPADIPSWVALDAVILALGGRPA